ncbi:hypothetical protein RFI_25159, partial [Reticulomyxa filosa]
MDRINDKLSGAPEGPVDGKDDDNGLQPDEQENELDVENSYFLFLLKKLFGIDSEDNDESGGILRPNKLIPKAQEHHLEIKNLRDVPLSFLGAPSAIALPQTPLLEQKIAEIGNGDNLIENIDDRFDQRTVLEAIDKDVAIVRLLDNCAKFLTDIQKLRLAINANRNRTCDIFSQNFKCPFESSCLANTEENEKKTQLYFLCNTSILLNFLHLDKSKNNTAATKKVVLTNKALCHVFKNVYNTPEKGINFDVYV